MIDFDWEDGVKADTVWVSGSYEGWTGKGDPLFDEDGDHIYSAVIPFYENGGIVEYNTQSMDGALQHLVPLLVPNVILILKMEMIITDFSLKMKTLNFLLTYLVVAAM